MSPTTTPVDDLVYRDLRDELDDTRCPECEGPVRLLGTLGGRVHVRCRDCGCNGSWAVAR